MASRLSIAAALTAVLIGSDLALAQTAPQRPTFFASTYNLASPIGATDVACLETSVNLVVRLLGIGVYGVADAAGIVNVSVVRRNTLNIGGTSETKSELTAVAKSDPAQSSAQAKMRVWTNNPTTLGMLDGTVRQLRWDITTTGSNPESAAGAGFNFTHFAGLGLLPTIRAGNSAFCLSFNAAPVATSNTIDFAWTEDDN